MKRSVHRYDRWFAVTSVLPVVAALLVALPGCQPSGKPPSQTGGSAGAEEEVRAASAAWDEAHNAGDLAKLVALYGDSAVSMPFNRPALEGRAAIEADFRAFFDTYTAHHTTEIVSLTVVEDWAIERGRYQLSATPKGEGAPFSETGKHVVIRRRVDGSWKVQMEIWNLDAPPRAE